MHVLDWWPVWLFVVTQLMTFAALRQQVKDLSANLLEAKLQHAKLENRVRSLEISGAPFAGFQKKGEVAR